MKNVNQKNSTPVLTLVHEYDAPRILVFNAFSKSTALAQWWGPQGYELTVASFDFRPGGMFHFKMTSPDRVMWARFIFGKIIEPESIEFILSFSDEHAGITRAPFFNPWPLEILNQVILEEDNEKTTLTFKCYPVNAGEDEITSFKTNMHSLQEGLMINLKKLALQLQKL